MAVEIIFQVGDMKYWQEHGDNKIFMKRIFKLLLDANIEAMERDLAEILRLSGEQERLWKAYEDWKGR